MYILCSSSFPYVSASSRGFWYSCLAHGTIYTSPRIEKRWPRCHTVLVRHPAWRPHKSIFPPRRLMETHCPQNFKAAKAVSKALSLDRRAEGRRRHRALLADPGKMKNGTARVSVRPSARYRNILPDYCTAYHSGAAACLTDMCVHRGFFLLPSCI